MKTCIKCNDDKPLSFFYKDKTYKDGLRGNCKDCQKNATRQAYRSNPDLKKEGVTRWRDANLVRKASIDGKKDAVRRGAVVPRYYDSALAMDQYALARKLTEETGIAHHVDHIIPCRLGGLHHHTNLQVLTAEDNLAKG